MADRKRRAYSIMPHQVEIVLEATAGVKTIGSALVSDDDRVRCEATEETFPAIEDFVTDVSDRQQWRAYMLAVCRRAVEVLEGGAT